MPLYKCLHKGKDRTISNDDDDDDDDDDEHRTALLRRRDPNRRGHDEDDLAISLVGYERGVPIFKYWGNTQKGVYVLQKGGDRRRRGRR